MTGIDRRRQELDARHRVIALHELVPVGVEDVNAGEVDPLRDGDRSRRIAHVASEVREATAGAAGAPNYASRAPFDV